MPNHFDYLIDKIYSAKFKSSPFKHLLIEDFLNKNDFREIIKSKCISTNNFSSHEEMFESLHSHGYKVQAFPGCINSVKDYMQFINSGKFKSNLVKDYGKDIIESYGMSLILQSKNEPILNELEAFVKSQDFFNCLIEKFSISKKTYIETGIQKYLTGYEISPHPDSRRKALTYMLNINPSDMSELMDIHTQLMHFKDKYKYIYDLWEFNQDIDRCWVPWSWCDRVQNTNHNNSIIIFKPSNKSMHAVHLEYDHLEFQRTQLYGNLWYREKNSRKSNLMDLDILSRHEFNNSKSYKNIILSKIINFLYSHRD